MRRNPIWDSMPEASLANKWEVGAVQGVRHHEIAARNCVVQNGLYSSRQSKMTAGQQPGSGPNPGYALLLVII